MIALTVAVVYFVAFCLTAAYRGWPFNVRNAALLIGPTLALLAWGTP